MNELSKGDCDRPNKAGKSGPKEQNPKPGAQIAQVIPSPLCPDLLQQAAEMYR